MNKQNGITLIALIITIIVMLILVAVTINVALNGGLFDKAKNARDLTQKQVEKEELMIAALGAYDEKTSEVNLTKLEEAINSLSNVYTDKSVKSSKYVLTGPSGTKWQIDLTTAEVKEYEEQINPWVGRGLSSTEVTYDTAYTGSVAIDSNLVFTSINFKSNGDIESNIQNAESSEIDNALSAGYVYIDSGNNLFVWQITSNEYAGFLIDSNEAKVYVHTSASNIITSGTYCGSLYVTPPANPLVGKTFVNPVYNSPGTASLGAVAGDYDITFTEDSWEIPYEYNGEKVAQGTYTYSNNSIHLLGTMDGSQLDQTIPLYTIEENGEVIEYYFICSLGFYTQYGNTNFVVPFTGEYVNSGNTAIFSIDQSTGYGLLGGTISPFGNICYCYDTEHDKFYWDIGSGTPVNDFSFAQDYSTVTINGTTYTKQQ